MVAHPHRGDVGADGFDDAGAFMAQHERAVDGKRPLPSTTWRSLWQTPVATVRTSTSRPQGLSISMVSTVSGSWTFRNTAALICMARASSVGLLRTLVPRGWACNAVIRCRRRCCRALMPHGGVATRDGLVPAGRKSLAAEVIRWQRIPPVVARRIALRLSAPLTLRNVLSLRNVLYGDPSRTHPVITAIRSVTPTRPSSSGSAANAAGNRVRGGTRLSRRRTAFASPAARRSISNTSGSA